MYMYLMQFRGTFFNSDIARFNAVHDVSEQYRTPVFQLCVPSSSRLPHLNFVNGHFQNFRMYLEYKNIIVEKVHQKIT